jgi:putative two-component system response regulator
MQPSSQDDELTMGATTMHSTKHLPTPAESASSLRQATLAAARILVVDDEQGNIDVLTRILTRAGCQAVEGTTSPEQGLRTIRDCRPDLVLLDLHMPELDGLEVLARVQPMLVDGPYLPIVFLSGDSKPEVRRNALRAGATDFITKPFDPIEVVLRIGNLLETRRLHLLQWQQNDELERRVLERTAELEESRQELLERLCRVAAYRDDATGAHTRRVGRTAVRLACELGIDDDTADLIGAAAELHDIGKVGVPDDILLKPGRLTDIEMAVMRRHAHIGGQALAGSRSPLLQLGEQIARWLHERWDGGGYPDGLKREEIPLAARIVAVVDVADALSHDRPYRPAWSDEAVCAELRAQSGLQFDPRIVDAFLRLHDRPHARAESVSEVDPGE